MVEIALSLAIIGFALIAIIGVLPAGMTVQKENREQNIINLDAAFLMDTLRTGARGQDNLVNYVDKITIVSQTCNVNGQAVGSPSTSIYTGVQLNSGAKIVGLLGTPKYIPTRSFLLGPGFGFISNSVIASLRAINGPAVDQGLSATARDFAFHYQVTVEIQPSGQYAFKTTDWGNMSAPFYVNSTNVSLSDSQVAQQLQASLNEVRLSFRWPMLPPGDGTKFGGGRQVFRSSAAGAITNFLVTNSDLSVMPLYFIQPLAYQSPQ